MTEVRNSRLMLLCPLGEHRQRLLSFMESLGIANDRVELVTSASRVDYLRRYGRVDIALDTAPYNGITTTCDATWMGVPVLTQPGRTPPSRAGRGLLSTVGLNELIAQSDEDFLRIAVELSGNLAKLAEMRSTLRDRMEASPLMDPPQFARNVESAYRKIWQRWVASCPT
jgi:predicted O-linked N-acetylglucosamine transferase (SPINDLY family)